MSQLLYHQFGDPESAVLLIQFYDNFFLCRTRSHRKIVKSVKVWRIFRLILTVKMCSIFFWAQRWAARSFYPGYWWKSLVGARGFRRCPCDLTRHVTHDDWERDRHWAYSSGSRVFRTVSTSQLLSYRCSFWWGILYRSRFAAVVCCTTSKRSETLVSVSARRTLLREFRFPALLFIAYSFTRTSHVSHFSNESTYNSHCIGNIPWQSLLAPYASYSCPNNSKLSRKNLGSLFLFSPHSFSFQWWD